MSLRKIVGALVVIALVLMLAPASATGQTNSTVFLWEDFNDGEIYNNPTWQPVFGGFQIVNGEFHGDGEIVDQSGRYTSTIQMFAQVETNGYLELSMKGRLKSVGNPQTGRGIHFAVHSDSASVGIHIQNGYNGGAPTNQHSLSIEVANPSTGQVMTLLATSYAPNFDQDYTVTAIRENGILSLYVDGALIGSAPDPFNGQTFVQIALGTTGSAAVDDLLIKVGSPNSPPNCSTAYPTIAELWPPSHQFEAVNILGVTDSDNDPITLTVTSIFQDEPTNGLGDGDVAPDAHTLGTDTAFVRAERSGTGNGRMYHINFSADDGHGGTCAGTVLVGVPHAKGKNDTIVDEGALYDSTAP